MLLSHLGIDIRIDAKEGGGGGSELNVKLTLSVTIST